MKYVLSAMLVCTACGPMQCKQTPIVITSHPTQPKPAGRITVGCDGKVVVDILADKVEK